MSEWGRSEQTAIAPRERRLKRAAWCIGARKLMSAVFPVTDEPDVHLDRTAKAQRWKRKLQIARLLIGHGAAVDAKSDTGETALSLAMSADADDRDLVSLLELMIDRGANVNAASTDAYTRTPLEGAIRSSRARRVACLLSHGADPRATVYEGGNLLELAHALGNPNVIALLDGAAKTP